MEILAVQLSKREAELLQQKEEVTKLAKSLKQVCFTLLYNLCKCVLIIWGMRIYLLERLLFGSYVFRGYLAQHVRDLQQVDLTVKSQYLLENTSTRNLKVPNWYVDLNCHDHREGVLMFDWGTHPLIIKISGPSTPLRPKAFNYQNYNRYMELCATL